MKPFLLAVLISLFAIPAYATDCRPGEKSCKVVVLNPEQEQTLIQMVENTGINGPFNYVQNAVRTLVELIKTAPAGTPVAEKKP